MYFIPFTPISILAKSHLGITLISGKGAAQLSKALKWAKNKLHSNVKWELRGRKLSISSASGIAAVWNRTCRCGVFPLLILPAYFFCPWRIVCHTTENQRSADSEGCLKKGVTTTVYSFCFQWCIPVFCSKSQPMEYFQVWEQIETSEMSNVTNYCRSTEKLRLWSEWFMKW